MVFHHCFRTVDLFEGYTISFFPFNESIVVDLALMGKICVSIFAFITGYGLYLSYGNKKSTPSRWALKRYVTTFSGFWVIFLIILVYKLIFSNSIQELLNEKGIVVGITNLVLDFLGLAKLLKTDSFINTWWYMSTVLVLILITPFIFKLINKYSWLTLITSLLLLRVILAQNEEGSFTGPNSVYAFIPVFILGAIFAKLNLFEKWMKFCNKGFPRIIKVICEIGIILICCFIYTKLPLDTFWGCRFCIIPAFIILFCVENIIQIKYVRTVLMFLGKHSMNIYLIHNFIRAILKNYIYACKHFALIVLVLLLVSLAFSVILELIKKLVKYNDGITRLCNFIEKKQ